VTDRPLIHSAPPAGPTEDEVLLGTAPPERGDDLRKGDPWRVFRIMGEFVEGFERLGDVTDAVTFLGSARTLPTDPLYQRATETAKLLAQAGYPIITGGGPGIMEAANRGAVEGGGLSIGVNIELPHEQGTPRCVLPLLFRAQDDAGALFPRDDRVPRRIRDPR
jgi:hypothetical protein